MLGQSLRYTAAVLGAFIAVALSLFLVQAFGLHGSELLLSLAAVTWVALYAGRAPALATAVLGGLGTALLEPHDTGIGAGRRAAVAIALYGMVAALIAHLGAKVRDSLARAHAARQEADRAARQLRQLQALADIALEDRPLGELLDELLARAARIFAADSAAVFALDDDPETLKVAAARGIEESLWRSLRASVGSGMYGRVLATRRPLRIDDLSTLDGVHREIHDVLRSSASVPLLVEGRALGVLSIGSRAPRRFTDEEISLLELVASRIARAMERVQLHEAVARRASQQAAIAALGQHAIAGADIGRLLQEAVDAAATHLQADYAAILELLPGGEELLPRAVAGGPLVAVPFRAASTQTEHTLSTRAAVVVHDYRTEARFAGSALVREHGIRSGMSVRIDGGGGQPFGTLGAYTRVKRAFTADDIHFLEALANVLSEDIRNRRIEEALREERDAARRAEEQKARLYQEALEAVRLREDFLSIASHELRTPLTPLELQMGSLRRLLRAEAELPRERVQQKLEVVARQVERLARLVDELLDLSRITAGKLRLRLEEVDLSAAARDAALRFREELARAGCPLHLTASGPVPGAWDRTRVDQVITNLLTNAIKYGAGKPIDLVVEGDAETAWIVVRDRGIGIEPDQQSRIFGRFERAVSERHYGGFGLGLWIVKQILDALGGTIRVESAPGQGSTFTVVLPRHPAQAGAAAA